MGENKPSAALREVGAELLRARNAKGMSQRDLAEAATISSISRISEMERGTRQLRVPEYERIMDALDITSADDRERIVGAVEAVRRPGQLNTGRTVISETLVQLMDLEDAAACITVVGPLLLPGLLQTTDYARQIYGDSADAQPRVALRAGRRDILTRRNPVELHALIDSEALLRPVVPPEELAYQLRHILDLAKLPNVTIQVMSSTIPGYHPMLSGHFELIEFPTASPIVLLDHYHASAFLRDPADVAVYVEAAEKIRNEMAMSPEASVELIAQIVHGMERQDDGT